MVSDFASTRGGQPSRHGSHYRDHKMDLVATPGDRELELVHRTWRDRVSVAVLVQGPCG